MTKRELTVAARIYSLAVIARDDTGETEDETSMVELASGEAMVKLNKYLENWEPIPSTKAGCLEQAKKYLNRKKEKICKKK